MMARDRGILCSGICLVLGLCLMTAPSAFDQEWWEKGFPGFGKSEKPYRTSHEEPDRQKVQPLNDLRPDGTPLRSQEMIDALEAAIERYQTIVTKGGWPGIPGTQPVR